MTTTTAWADIRALLPADTIVDTHRSQTTAAWHHAGTPWRLTHRAAIADKLNPIPASITIVDGHGSNVLALTNPDLGHLDAHLQLLGAIDAAAILSAFTADADLPDEILLFGERYIAAWMDGDVGQRNRVVDQLHTALQRQLTGSPA